MHQSVMTWVSGLVDELVLRERKVLEVGCMDVSGSVRHLFNGHYVGVDQVDGKGVDRVMDAHKLEYDNDSFDVVISLEMLEHDSRFWLSVMEMARVLKPGGFLILSARGNGFAEHKYPMDYWRFMPDSFPMLMTMAGCEIISIKKDTVPGMLGVGRKM